MAFREERAACREAPVGKHTPTALYVHQSALTRLPPALRIYEGCARAFVGVLVLKPLAEARRDGAPVFAVIRGSAVNQDGPSSGFTVPNAAAQCDLIRQALANAGLRADEIDVLSDAEIRQRLTASSR
ncbi:MAG: hypothetical protein GY835_18705 [bacterium]|nr:hypothetical protein [bacterium]